MSWRPWRRRAEDADASAELRLEAERARVLVEHAQEFVVVIDDRRRVLAASRLARATSPEIAVGEPLPAALLAGVGSTAPTIVRYGVGGRREALVLSVAPHADAALYEELRVGFTAAVSHELRTPLARQLALLDTALLPGENTAALVEQARSEVEHMRGLVDDVLFLSELETGHEVVTFGETPAAPVLEEVVEAAAASADRAGVRLELHAGSDVCLPLRARMLRVLAGNLVENSIRYAGAGTACTVSVEATSSATTLTVADTGAGVPPEHLPRLFERFYRADQARSSRGTGLGLAIVKHIVTAAGGTVDAANAPEGGLVVSCRFPA